MTKLNYPFGNNVTLIGAGEVSREVLEEALKYAPDLVAADGGAGRALGWGHDPALVVGDMDSLDAETRATIRPERLVAIAEQDSTDFDKALGLISAPLILGVGFLGGRLDHGLASLSTLARAEAGKVVLLGGRELCFHVPARIELALAAGSGFSLFPLASVRVRASGLVWPLDGLELTPLGRIGTSNRVGPGGRVRLRVAGDGLLAVLPRAALAAVIEGLAAPG